MSTAYIQSISIVAGARSARVTSPITGERATHGLGAVGDPILPLLGHRAEGYEIAFPEDVRDVVITAVHTHLPLAPGRYPAQRAPWSALGAPDFEPFGSGK